MNSRRDPDDKIPVSRAKLYALLTAVLEHEAIITRPTNALTARLTALAAREAELTILERARELVRPSTPAPVNRSHSTGRPKQWSRF